MDECEGCQKLQEALNALQEEYDTLYKAVDNTCFNIEARVNSLRNNL